MGIYSKNEKEDFKNPRISVDFAERIVLSFVPD